MVLPLVIHEDSGDVLGIKQIAHRAERDHNHAVVIIVSALHLVLVHAHHLEAHAVDADALSQALFTEEGSPFPNASGGWVGLCGRRLGSSARKSCDNRPRVMTPSGVRKKTTLPPWGGAAVTRSPPKGKIFSANCSPRRK